MKYFERYLDDKCLQFWVLKINSNPTGKLIIML